MNPLVPLRGRFVPSLALIGCALIAFAVMAANASALTPAQPKFTGAANLTIGNGKAGRTLVKSGVKVNRIAPATAKRAGKLTRAKLPVRRLEIANRNVVALKGGITLRRGSRAVSFDQLNVLIRNKNVAVTGRSYSRIGKKRSPFRAGNLFRIAGKPVFASGPLQDQVQLKRGTLALTPAGSKLVKQKLRIKGRVNGVIGAIALNAKRTVPADPCTVNPNAPGCNPDPCVADPNAAGCNPDPCAVDPNAEGCVPVPVDPYLAQCDVAATSQVPGNVPPFTPLPTPFAGEVQTVSSPVNWGIKASLRGYLSAPFGYFEGLDGATVNRPGPGAPPTGFTFPAGTGQYTPNSTATLADDQAVINGTGSVLFCHREQFRVLLSNPTIVLDGDDSRLIVDVDTNNKGVWTTTQRVDLVELDVSAIEPVVGDSGREVRWNDVPTTLTQAGSDALTLCDAATGAPGGPCAYAAGVAMDSISFGVETTQPYAMCSMTNTTGFSSTPVAIPATVAPTLTPTGSVSGGGLEWGFRRGTRTSVQSSGHIALANGALRSDDNMGEPAPTPPATTTKFFTWPVLSGDYQAVAGGDDRLVLNGSGYVSLCNTTHGYGAIISDPTIVIDGADSYISADVTVRQGPDWVTDRIDVVRFNLAGVDPTSTPVSGGTQLSWTANTVTSAGPGGSPTSLLSVIGAGAGAFDWLTVKATVAD